MIWALQDIQESQIFAPGQGIQFQRKNTFLIFFFSQLWPFLKGQHKRQHTYIWECHPCPKQKWKTAQIRALMQTLRVWNFTGLLPHAPPSLSWPVGSCIQVSSRSQNSSSKQTPSFIAVKIVVSGRNELWALVWETCVLQKSRANSWEQENSTL